MSLSYPHQFDEVSVLNLDKDYLETSHTGGDPEKLNQTSYKVKVSDLFDVLSSEIRRIAKINKLIEVENDDIGNIYYTTVYKSHLDDMTGDLLSGTVTPLCRIDGKKLVYHQTELDNFIQQDESTIDIFRNDISAFFEYASMSQSPLVSLEDNSLSINGELMEENYIYNVSSDNDQYVHLSSSAPVLSGLFPSGNKPMGVTMEEDLVGGCMKVSDDTVKMYLSKQSLELKNGMSYYVKASDYSNTYGKNDDDHRIFVNTVDYVPYMVIKSDVLSVRL